MKLVIMFVCLLMVGCSDGSLQIFKSRVNDTHRCTLNNVEIKVETCEQVVNLLGVR